MKISYVIFCDLMLGEHFWLFGLKFDTYSFFIYLAFLFAGLFFYKYCAKIHINFWQFALLFSIIAIFAPLGASALSALEFGRPFSSIFNRESGATHLGGYLIGLSFFIILARLMNLSVLRALDGVTFSWIIGYAVGRLACFFSGDGCYGIATSSFLGMTFPHGIVPTTAPVFPTPLFETGYSLIIFIVFYYVYERQTAKPFLPGRIFFGASAWMLLCRFAVEFIRRNPRYAGYSLSQWISMPLIVGYSISNIWLDKWHFVRIAIFPKNIGIENSPLSAEPPINSGS